jgi:fluoroacetyl-CoA thioesterase
VVKPGLAPGIARTLTYQVQPQDLVTTLFGGAAEFGRKPAVLATGILVALCEWPAMDALRQVIGDDEDSLGTGVCLAHRAPVAEGTRLLVTARCVSVRGRASRWDVCARDGTRDEGWEGARDEARIVADGWVEFAVVRTAAFVERHMVASGGAPALGGARRDPVGDYARPARDRVLAPGTVVMTTGGRLSAGTGNSSRISHHPAR